MCPAYPRIVERPAPAVFRWTQEWWRQERSGPMSVQLNHTIVACRDQELSASFLTEILGLPAATRYGRFLVVGTDNGVSLDYAQTDREITAQHYAFLIGEDDFDPIFGQITAKNVRHWADPGRARSITPTADGASTSKTPTVI